MNQRSPVRHRYGQSKHLPLKGSSGAVLRRFPGSLRAAKRAELAFRVASVLQEMNAIEGLRVKKGALLARLDPTDYQLQLQDRQATFDNARNNFERGKQLVGDGNISRTNFDRMEASFKTSQAALNLAKQELEYTELRAPFDGRIASREAENFEEVLAKQTVIHFQNDDFLDVLIDVPESLVRSIRLSSEEDESVASTRVIAVAEFEGRPEQQFELTFKEIATRADAQTQTFRVTMIMDGPDDLRVLPGMTVNVELDLSRVVETDTSKWVPTNAVVADSGLDATVWLLDDQSMTVSSHPVSIGRISGSKIEITSGLIGGEEIVSVGAVYLAEGMAVTRMKLTEQAIPREDSSPVSDNG